MLNVRLTQNRSLTLSNKPKSPKSAKIATPPTKPTSLVTFLLDRSQSMNLCKEATIEGFNGYISGLQNEKDAEIDVTFLQFDTVSLDKVCVARPVAQMQMLTESTYVPRGGTPLIDAAVKTINAVAESLKLRDVMPKVVICIQTDGQENASKEHTWEELRGLITTKTAEGWQFNFLGAGINAYDQGSRMGIAAGSTMSYDSTSKSATRAAFASSAANASNYAAGRVGSTMYSAQDRQSAGDAYAPPDLGGSQKAPVSGMAYLKPSYVHGAYVKPNVHGGTFHGTVSTTTLTGTLDLNPTGVPKPTVKPDEPKLSTVSDPLVL
jgi:hypothetical protein